MSHQPVPAERYFAGNPALPVAQACQHDDADAVAQALAMTHVSPNAVGEQGMSLLLLAMSNRAKNAVLALLQHGANPNLRTELGRNRLIIQPVGLAAGGDDIEMLKLLLDHGGDPNSHFGQDPAIFNATPSDANDRLDLLFDHGADINARNRNGYPLLVYAAVLRQFKRVVYLMERGADVHLTGKLGNTVAYELQDQGFRWYSKPDNPQYASVIKAKHLLEAKGIRFPVPDPYAAYRARVRAENAQRRQWEATPEGHRWLDPIKASDQALELGQQPTLGYNARYERRAQAEPVFQAWRKTQPGWFPTTNDAGSIGYADPPALATEAVEDERRQEQHQADSARWAQQAAALH